MKNLKQETGNWKLVNWPVFHLRFSVSCFPFLLFLLLSSAPRTAPAAWSLGGDARYYQFVQLDNPSGDRRDSELGVFRLKGSAAFADEITAEAHGVVGLQSPATTLSTTIASGTTRHYLDLQHSENSGDDLLATLEMDRLNLTWEQAQFRFTVGRQAITWGVSYFWPVLDLFAPFAPQRIDREYKPGVDALRLTIPIADFSQLEVAAAGQGTSLQRDGSAGALLRVHLGAADVGLMLGRFHHDTVAGGFVTADVMGSGLRAEAAHTDSGDSYDASIDRARFWRLSAGFDRQLTPALNLTTELAWNEFGTGHVHDYPFVALADRVSRGEVTSLAQYYAAAALAWQAHPLLTLTASGLWNIDDGSVLAQPYAEWSLADSIAVTLGGTFGIGPGPRAGPFGLQLPRSEYGSAPQLLYAALKFYF